MMAERQLVVTLEANFGDRSSAWKQLRSGLDADDGGGKLTELLVRALLKLCVGRALHPFQLVSRSSRCCLPILKDDPFDIIEGFAACCPSLIGCNAPKNVIDMATTGYLYHSSLTNNRVDVEKLLGSVLHASVEDETFSAVTAAICLRYHMPSKLDYQVALHDTSTHKVETLLRDFDASTLRAAARSSFVDSTNEANGKSLEWPMFHAIVSSMQTDEPFFRQYLDFIHEDTHGRPTDWKSSIGEVISGHVQLMADNNPALFFERDSSGNTFINHMVQHFGPGSAEAIGVICDSSPDSLCIPNNCNELPSQVTLGDMLERVVEYRYDEYPVKYPLTACYFIVQAHPRGLSCKTRHSGRSQFHNLVLDALQVIYDCALHFYDDQELDCELRAAVHLMIQTCVSGNPDCVESIDGFGNTALHDIARMANLDKLPETDRARFSHFSVKPMHREDGPDSVVEIVKLLANEKSALIRNNDGMMPLHVLYSATGDDFHEATMQGFVFDSIFNAAPGVLEISCPHSRLYPFQSIASRYTDWHGSEALDDIFNLISASPHLIVAHLDRDTPGILDEKEYFWATKLELEASRVEMVAMKLRRKARQVYQKMQVEKTKMKSHDGRREPSRYLV